MSFWVIVRDAVIVVVVCSVMALAFNALRPGGLEFIATKDYEVFVPCPEPVGEAEAIDAADVLWYSDQELVLDSRVRSDYESWHPAGARSVPYDFLEAVPDDVVRELSRTKARRIVVIGDGLDPDTGRELARELSGRGLKNMYYIPGGIEAVRSAVEGGDG